MRKYKAILVEDEPTALAETVAALELAGFLVVTYGDASAATIGISQEAGPIDLLVLDRRLPLRPGSVADDAVGDDLLDTLLQSYVDLVSIVFSGHTGFEHAQFATAKRGVVSLREGDVQFDRVRIFEKGQSLEFDKYLGEIHGCLGGMEDIQIDIDGSAVDLLTRRLLRRVAFEYRADSISAQRLAGGLSDSPVWLCGISGTNGPIARVVIKRQAKRPHAGGFQSILPAPLVAGTIGVLHGFSGGYFLSVQQVAGADPAPLMNLIVSDPERAARILKSLNASLSSMKNSDSRVNRTVAEIAEPLVKWTVLQAIAAEWGVDIPPGSRVAGTIVSPQHGDLHPANVLATDDSPVIIDFDSQTDGSELIDAAFLLFGPVFHRESPLRTTSTWPSAAQCSRILDRDEFLNGCPAVDYFAEALREFLGRKKTDRELFGVLLAYAVRQLKYDDIVNDDTARNRALAIAVWAASRLEDT